MAALLLALVGAATACGSTCQDLAEEYDGVLREEMARAGPAVVAIGSGEYHLGMTLSQGLIEQVVGRMSESLPPVEPSRPLSVGGSGRSGRRSAVQVSAQLVLEGMETVEADRNGVRLLFGLRTHVGVRRPGHREDHFLPGSLGVQGTLAFRDDEGGQSVLEVALEELDPGGVAIATHALDAEVGDAVRGFLEPAVRGLLFEQIRSIPLLRFPALSLGPVRVTLAPAGLALEERSLFMGFVTNLRPRPGGEVRPETDVPEGSLRLAIHPGLVEAALRVGLAEGTLAHHYDRELALDPDGPVHITLERMEFVDEGVQLDFRIWELGSGGCRSWIVATSGRTQIREGRVSLTLTEARTLTVAGRQAEEADALSWLRSPFAAESTALAERLIGLGGIRLGDGGWLALAPVALDATAGRIDVELQ